MSQPRMVLIDLGRKQSEFAAHVGDHPLQLSPARLPCSVSGDDLAQLQAFANGMSESCAVVLTFRFQDLDDMGVPIIQADDVLTGVFDTSGGQLMDLRADAPTVESTYAAGGGLSLGRPGRHLLCVQFAARRVAATALDLAATASMDEGSVNTP